MFFRQLLNDEMACASYLLGFASEDAFVEWLVSDMPPAPPQRAAIVAANRSGRRIAEVA